MPQLTQKPHHDPHQDQGMTATITVGPQDTKRLLEREIGEGASAFMALKKKQKVDMTDAELNASSVLVVDRKKVTSPSVSSTSSSSSSSKAKTKDDAEIDVNDTKAGSNSVGNDNGRVDPHELASAFALASLAGMSPGNMSTSRASNAAGRPEFRDVKQNETDDNAKDEGVRNAASWDETRSPKADQHPISPEQRSPGSITTHHETPTDSSMDDRSTSSASRKVHFAPNTKESSSPSTGVAVKARLAASRRLVMPQHRAAAPPSPAQSNAGNATGMMTVSPRPHRMFGPGGPMPPFARTPPHLIAHPNYLRGTPPPPPPPHHPPYHHPHHPHHLHPGVFHPHVSPQPHPHPHHFGGPHPGNHPWTFRPGPGPHPVRYPHIPRHLLQPPLLHHANTPGHMMGVHNQAAAAAAMERQRLHRHAAASAAAAAAAAAAAENQWICDYCNVASFGTYEEACVHEESCQVRHLSASSSDADADSSFSARPRSIIGSSRSRSDASAADEDESTAGSVGHYSQHQHHKHGVSSLINSHQQWYQGTLSLAIEESDRDWLSDLNCFIRSHCVEAFSATEDDVSRSSKRGRISLHQVGIRCCFCADLPPSSKESKDSDPTDGEATTKGSAAVSFPTTITGIYESVKRWQRVHLEVCEHVPATVREQLNALGSSNVWVPTTRQYWADAARALGLVDTDEGIRFGQDPAAIKDDVRRITNIPSGEEASVVESSPRTYQHHFQGSPGGMGPPSMLSGMAHLHHAAFGAARDHPHQTSPGARVVSSANQGSGGDGHQLSQQQQQQHVESLGGHIIFPEDMEMIPPYVYFLMRQVEPCLFTEADRFVARSKGPVGYPGFQCRHCNGHAGLGKYFPVSSKSLSTNSTSQNIHAHLLKCRKCPDAVKDRLVQLKIEKSRAPRLEPGWRKVFFDRVWARLHGDQNGIGGDGSDDEMTNQG